MIIVTGTKRSGTSMWMQLMKAAGLPVIGDPFPGRWKDSIGDANKKGFYESFLRRGIYHATNPHPRTGDYLHPETFKYVAVKVFVPGLLRTDHAQLHRVVATMRNWREYPGSLERLYGMEQAFRVEQGRRRREPVRIAPVLEWWLENYMLIRDVATRRYPIHLITYERLLADPANELPPIFRWLGVGDADAAIAQVDPAQRTQRADQLPTPDGVEPEVAEVFDAFYARVHSGEPLDAAFIERLNDTHDLLLDRIEESLAGARADAQRRQRIRRMLRQPGAIDMLRSRLGDGPDDAPIEEAEAEDAATDGHANATDDLTDEDDA